MTPHGEELPEPVRNQTVKPDFMRIISRLQHSCSGSTEGPKLPITAGAMAVLENRSSSILVDLQASYFCTQESYHHVFVTLKS